MRRDEAATCMARSASPMPRFLTVGELTLDLFHRDARIDDRWLSLFPREFELLWYLCEHPGKAFTRRELLSEVWRIDHDPRTNSLAVHVARLRAKLAEVELSHLILTHPSGGYFLDPPEKPGIFGFDTGTASPLDSAVRLGHASDRTEEDR